MLKRFLRDSAIYVVPAVVSNGLGFFLLPIYTRALSPADYGALELLILFAAIIKLTITLEVTQALGRFFTDSRDGYDRFLYVSSAIWFTLAVYAVFLGVMLAFAEVGAALVLGAAHRVDEFRVGVVYIASAGLFYLVQNHLRWELRPKDYALVSLTMSFTTAFFAIWLAYMLELGLKGLLVGMLLGCGLGAGLGMIRLRGSFGFAFSASHLREMLRFSTPLVFSSVAVWLSLYIDRIMIARLLSLDDLGLYGVGYRVASAAGLLMIGFQGALTPLIYKHYREPETADAIWRIFRLFVALALTAFATLAVMAPDLVRLLATPEFFGAASVVVFLVPAVFLKSMYIFTPGLMIAKKTAVFAALNIVGACANVGLNWLLIPQLGIRGAALATMITALCVFSLYVLLGQRHYAIPFEWKRVVPAAGVIFALVFWSTNLPYEHGARHLAHVLVVFFAVAVCVALGLVTRAEIGGVMRTVTAIFRERPRR